MALNLEKQLLFVRAFAVLYDSDAILMQLYSMVHITTTQYASPRSSQLHMQAYRNAITLGERCHSHSMCASSAPDRLSFRKMSSSFTHLSIYMLINHNQGHQHANATAPIMDDNPQSPG